MGRRPLVLALVLGVLAGAAAYLAIRRREAQVVGAWKTVQVLAALKDIPEGTVLTSGMVGPRAIPEQFVTSSAVKPDKGDYVLGQRVLVPLQAGDPLLWSQLETTRGADRLSSRVQRKGRALTLEASASASVGGWVRPNDHVDVIGTFRDPQSSEQTAVTLLQNVLVLATGHLTDATGALPVPEDERSYSHLTLLVLPEEAEILVLAAELGSLSFSLRNGDDVDIAEERGRATLSTLLSGERTRVLEARRREVIHIIRGSAESRTALGGSAEAP